MKDSSQKIEAKGERFGRAKKPTAPEILEVLDKRSNPRSLEVASYYCQSLIHRAHVVMLHGQDILTRDETAKILKGIKEVERDAKDDNKLTSYMATETALIDKVGEVGGKMHIGRSRNDLAQTQRRMFYRDNIEKLIEAIIEFQKALLGKAQNNVETVMSGYTHWRQAQPITLGHYLVAHVDAAIRSVERLEDIYKRTNLNTLGAGALAATGWNIDRNKTMELLGFDNLCENSYDCVAAHDYVIEFTSAIMIHMSNLSRLAEDIQIWSSDEFGMIDLDESYAGTSSIMPQKKNPSSLEMIKGLAAESIGALVKVASSVKGVAYTNIGDRMALEPLIIETTIGCSKIMSGVISTLEPHKETMMSKVTNGFSTMTELADTLVRNHGISFRQAHDIIANITSKVFSEGKTAKDITVGMIEDAALTNIGERLEISERELQLATDPFENVKRRSVIGGPAPKEVKRMIHDRLQKINNIEIRHQARQKKLENAYQILSENEKTILS